MNDSARPHIPCVMACIRHFSAEHVGEFLKGQKHISTNLLLIHLLHRLFNCTPTFIQYDIKSIV